MATIPTPVPIPTKNRIITPLVCASVRVSESDNVGITAQKKTPSYARLPSLESVLITQLFESKCLLKKPVGKEGGQRLMAILY